MRQSRTAAMLCVLLGHALLVLGLMNLTQPKSRRDAPAAEEFVTELLILTPDIDDGPQVDSEEFIRRYGNPPPATLSAPFLSSDAMDGGAAPGESAAISAYTDWPVEGKQAAARVLAAEAEAERIAKLFAGPQGTWASLTKRQKSELSKFRWKPGVDGLERDAKGNTIWVFKSGCTLVNFSFIGCPIGAKQPAYGDLFKDMRLYFDEQRLPQTDEGNGREPESMRPPKWSKPLE